LPRVRRRKSEAGRVTRTGYLGVRVSPVSSASPARDPDTLVVVKVARTREAANSAISG
jgi:hypothetical protein